MVEENSATRKYVLELIGHVYDPDYRDRSIVDMGLVDEESITIENDGIKVVYRVTAPMCPFSAAIGMLIRYVLTEKLGLPIDVSIAGGHRQTEAVSAVLESEERSREL